MCEKFPSSFLEIQQQQQKPKSTGCGGKKEKQIKAKLQWRRKLYITGERKKKERKCEKLSCVPIPS